LTTSLFFRSLNALTLAEGKISVTRPEQKQQEREILGRYLRTIGLKGEIEKGPEPPDFIVTVDGRRLGIEITEYHQPAPSRRSRSRRMVEAEWRKLRDAVLDYRETHTGLENLSVILRFVQLEVPGRKDHKGFIRAVHNEIERVRPELDRQAKVIHIGDRHPALLRQYLDGIVVGVVGSYLEWDWNLSFAGVGTSDEELTTLLASKLRLERPSGVDELQLVMAGDGPTAATCIGFLRQDLLKGWPNLNNTLEQSNFDAVTILHYRGICMWRRG
jgi:hypothetical protein